MHRTRSRISFGLMVALLLLITACNEGQPVPAEGTTVVPEPTMTVEPTEEVVSQAPEQPSATMALKATETRLPTATPEAVEVQETSEATQSATTASPEAEATPTVALPTAEPAAVATASGAVSVAPGGSLVVDHTSVADFERIPDEYIAAAQELRMIFIDRSVGSNINDGLTCLSHVSQAQAPNHCVRYEHVDPAFSVDPAVVSWNRPGGYDRSNWEFQLSGSGCEGPGWTGMVTCFIEMVDPVIDNYDVLSFQFSYLTVAEGSAIADPAEGFFSDSADVENVNDQAAYEAQHADKVFIYWTTSLARGIGTSESEQFNDQMRQYAIEHGKPLFDVAAILSHDPDGNPCYDHRDGVPYDNGNNIEDYPDDGQDYLAICQHYTTETDGGHLGSVSAGKIRTAKAFWVLMARIAGWDGS